MKRGYYEIKIKRERSRKIDREKLKQAVAENHGAYLYELAQPFGCTPQAVFSMLGKLKITLKKDFYLSRVSAFPWPFSSGIQIFSISLKRHASSRHIYTQKKIKEFL